MRCRPVALLAALLAVVFAAGCTTDSRSDASAPQAVPTGPACVEPPASAAPAPADPALPALPAMSLQCFTGGHWTSIADLGGPTIVNLWASWCGPCREELPTFQRLVAAANGKVRVVGIVTRDDHDAAQSVIDHDALTFPMLEDRGQVFATSVGRTVSRSLVNLPATLFITPGGRIAYVYQGRALTDVTIRTLVAEHLGVT